MSSWPPVPPPPRVGGTADAHPSGRVGSPREGGELGVAPAGGDPRALEDYEQSPRWAAWQGVLGFVAAYLGTATVLLFVSVAVLPAGVDLEHPPPVFNVIGVLLQDLVFIAAALAFAAISARPRRSHFGIRRTPLGRTLGWAALGVVSYLVFALLYQLFVDPQGKQSIAEALGVREGGAFLVIGGFVVVVMAPVAEEFFFRAFFYRAVRNSLSRPLGRATGVLFAAVITGLLFGVMHLEPGRLKETLPLIPLLVVLGVVFCLVYELTNSLFAVIGLHAVVNMFGYLVVAKNSWIVALAFGGAMVTACLVLPRLLPRAPAPTPAPA